MTTPDKSKVSDPTKPRVQDDNPTETPEERHGIPEEFREVESSGEDTEVKGRPTSDRAKMETTVIRQKT